MRPSVIAVVVVGIALAGLPAGGCASASDAESAGPKEGDTIIDPVCGIETPVFEGSAVATHEGRTYHFCSATCAEAFQQEPERYAGK